MLTFDHVTFTYEGENEPIIKDLSFHIEKGEFVSIIGASGCGKSTVFRLLNRLETSDTGTIQTQVPFSAYMPQKDLLFPWRTIEQNICLPCEIQKNVTGLKERAETVLKEVGLFEYRDKFPKDLSGGMRQRASFARTLLTGSELFLLDEPFSALDSLTRMELQEWLLSIWEKHHQTILFVTHDVEEALFLSNRIFIVKDRPISYLEEYQVPLSFPRKRSDLKSPEVLDLKEHLIAQLRQEVLV